MNLRNKRSIKLGQAYMVLEVTNVLLEDLSYDRGRFSDCSQAMVS